jgi:sugar phosphate isomerase/epimerase
MQCARPLPTIALSAKWHTYPERFRWAAEHGFALEYSPNPDSLDSLARHLDPFLRVGVAVRYHAFFPGYEIGHPEPGAAQEALDLHLRALEAMQARGEQVLTVHIGLHREHPVDPDRAVQNLTTLVERGQTMGITVCLENLRRGPTSNPRTVVAWAEAARAMLTLDAGHMLSCQQVQSGAFAVHEFIDLFAHRLVEVHMYEEERDRHYPPRDMTILGPIVDRLLTTPCTWWTIELDDCAEVLATRALLLHYLRSQPPALSRV